MSINRPRARAASSSSSSYIATESSILQDEPLSVDQSPFIYESQRVTEEKKRQLNKVRSILDIYQPNDFGPRELSQAKDGILPARIDPVTRVRTHTYMIWANALTGLALRDERVLYALSYTMPDSIVMLEDCRAIVNEALGDYESGASGSGSDPRARDRQLEAIISGEISKTKSVTDGDPENQKAWLYAVAILLIILEKLLKHSAHTQSSLDTQLRLMELATNQLKLYPEDILREYAGSFRRIATTLETQYALSTVHQALIASTVKDIVRKIG